MDRYDRFRLYRGLVQLLEQSEERTLDAVGRLLIEYGQTMVAEAQAQVMASRQQSMNGTARPNPEAEELRPTVPSDPAQPMTPSVSADVPEA